MSISGMDVAGGRRTSHAQHRLRTVATDVVVWRGLNAIAITQQHELVSRPLD